jgi:hypothetical protein
LGQSTRRGEIVHIFGCENNLGWEAEQRPMAEAGSREGCSMMWPDSHVPEMIKTGRWFVSVKTGNGPDSHIGDFATEAEAKDWVLTKSKYWPSKPDTPK